ncbi:hypothetical protein KKB83_02465, partial [Patescibacteria group bacterium]|nr:hypothetical protein [Patescibacteria group bacterium]
MASFYLSNLHTEDDLKAIVIERWGYSPLPSLPLIFDLKEETRKKILTATVIAEHAGFQILFFQLDEEKKTHNQIVDQFLRSTEREIISQIPEAEHQTKLFVFSSADGNWWHFIHTEQVGSKLKLKRFSIDPDNRNKLRTASEQLDVIKIDPLVDTTLQKVRDKHEAAFRVELLTMKFYEDYVRVFNELRQELLNQKSDIDDALKTAHHYTHLLLNRIMFLYFVQKRGCFEGEKDFLHIFWNAYRDNFEGQNEFLEKWLKILFFEALNQEPGSYMSKEQFKKLPGQYPDFNLILQQSPYLNGGLFEKNDNL